MTHLDDSLSLFLSFFLLFPPIQVRVAKSNYTFPKLVAGHFVIFDDDLACLIVFNLYKVGLFHRVKMSASLL